ncbi:hypothetical protein Aperf_G00000000828 [Anoplocephala perfoliata]
MRIVLLSLFFCSVVTGYVFVYDPPRSVNFGNCQSDICSTANYTGYGCVGGRCVYLCRDGFCDGYSGTREYLSPLKEAVLARNWAPGAKGQHGCGGGDCGFWGGCEDGYCTGRFDFRNCRKSHCQSGPFRGYGCYPDRCRVICNSNICHVDSYYGNQMIEDGINQLIPFDIGELSDMDISKYEEVDKNLFDQSGTFWSYYKKNPEKWEADKNDPDLWAFLLYRVGRLELRAPQIAMPSDVCDAPYHFSYY